MMPELRRTLIASDHAANGDVVVWDHGPHDKPHKHPVPMRMTPGDAGQALQADRRYALEPALDDGEVTEEMNKIKADREEAAKVAAERAEATQAAADRRAAIEIVAARHQNEPQEEEPAEPVVEPVPAPPPDHPPFSESPIE